jgi:hypothetical protein
MKKILVFIWELVKRSKRTLMFLTLVLVMLFAVPTNKTVIAKDIPSGWNCACVKCGHPYLGSKPTYYCGLCGGGCTCTQTIVKL